MPERLASFARSLRRNGTSAERRLWQGLRRKEVAGFRFRRQVVLAGIIADFASFDARLVIEVDGATHSTDEELARDAMRTAALAAQGFALLRFTNDEVFHNFEGRDGDDPSEAHGVEAAHRGICRLSLSRPASGPSRAGGLSPRALVSPILSAWRDPPSCPSPTRGEGTPATAVRSRRRLSEGLPTEVDA